NESYFHVNRIEGLDHWSSRGGNLNRSHRKRIRLNSLTQILRGIDLRQISIDRLIDLTLRHRSSLLDDQRMLADASHSRHVVTNEKYRATLNTDVAHLLETLFLKLRVTDSQHLIDQQHFRLEMRR